VKHFYDARQPYYSFLSKYIFEIILITGKCCHRLIPSLRSYQPTNSQMISCSISISKKTSSLAIMEVTNLRCYSLSPISLYIFVLFLYTHLAFNVSAPSDSDLFEAALIGFRQIARLFWAARNYHKFQYRLLADTYTHGIQCVSAHRTKLVTLLVHFALHLHTNWSVYDDGK